MCRIVGIISSNLSAESNDWIDLIAYRGSDGMGIFAGKNIKLGHARLSIQDVSVNGHQLMFSSDNRYVIIFNGEIYYQGIIRTSTGSLFVFKGKYKRILINPNPLY